MTVELHLELVAVVGPDRVDKDVQTSLNFSMKMLKFISQNLDLDLDGNRFSKWLKGSRGPWNTFGTIMTV
jgi:hypothetical protein